ncbi:MAG: nickel-responsive transcriptional regulator NikR [Planctomycetes bacterium]|nr:nickel-responsive transcriptional regulator NikR [Planctomycetota bacterium]
MRKLARFTVSMEEDLLRAFDALSARRRLRTRSEAVRKLIRERLVERAWAAGNGRGREPVAAAILLVYDHQRPELLSRIVQLQHEFEGEVLSASHVHWTRDTCLEVILARGRPTEVEGLADSLISLRGVKHGRLVTTSPADLDGDSARGQKHPHTHRHAPAPAPAHAPTQRTPRPAATSRRRQPPRRRKKATHAHP